MLKTIGAALIACACAMTGFVFAAVVKRRLTALECALQAVALLRPAVVLQLQPLASALDALSGQNPLLKALHDTPPAQWAEAMQKTGLGKEEIRTMQTLLYAIPRAAAGSTAHFDAAQEQFGVRLNLQRSAAEQSAALYPKLGLLCGAAVFLMLI